MNFQAIKEPKKTILVSSCLALVALGLWAPAAGASGGLTPPPPPDPTPGADTGRSQILDRAELELSRNVRERGSDNVPRYHRGRGRIVPYSIGAAWCAAFSTWIWSEVGFDSFLRSRTLRASGTIWRAYGGDRVAVQVRALRSWAKRAGQHTYRATPGDLVAYGDGHIGIVTKVNRKRRAVRSIEGNYDDGVRARTIPMSSVIDYFSPMPVKGEKRVLSPLSRRADIEYEAHSPDRPGPDPVQLG